MDVAFLQDATTRLCWLDVRSVLPVEIFEGRRHRGHRELAADEPFVASSVRMLARRNYRLQSFGPKLKTVEADAGEVGVWIQEEVVDRPAASVNRMAIVADQGLKLEVGGVIVAFHIDVFAEEDAYVRVGVLVEVVPPKGLVPVVVPVAANWDFGFGVEGDRSQSGVDVAVEILGNEHRY
jgi:hypothetical protein